MIKENQYIPQIVFHPGETLAEKLIELGIGSKEFALCVGKPEKTISEVLHGKSSITADMAVLFENALKIPAHFWMNAQCSYDEFTAKKKMEKVFENSISWAIKFPYAEMAKMGWIPPTRIGKEKTRHLFEFFGIATEKAWENYYLVGKLQAQFRVSLKHAKEPEAISAWLRKGVHQSMQKKVSAYSEKRFKEVLKTIKEELMAKQPDNYFTQLVEMCQEAGVKVLATPCLPKAPIGGCTRWLNGTPIMQLSGKYRRNDIFWFTFFHEAGHILKHGKKDIFIENKNYKSRELIKEKEADEFAIDWTFPEEAEKELLLKQNLTEEDIVYFAEKYSTHPALIIGRLQHNKIIHHSIGTQFFHKIDLSKYV